MTIETTKQVDLLYALFLGRLPENNFIRQDNLGRPTLDLVRAMIISGEFRESVLDRFMLRRALPHRGLSHRLLPDVLALVADLRLAGPFRGAATADWQFALGRVLASSPCREIVRDGYGAEGLQLIDQLNPSSSSSAVEAPGPPTASAPASEIVFGAEVVANAVCRGWITDLADRDAPLHVAVKLNGGIVKTLVAKEFRRDVQERHGGNGCAGFTVCFDQLPEAQHLSRATVEIIELGRGTVILPDHVVEFCFAPAMTLAAELRDELQRQRDIVARLRTRLEAEADRRRLFTLPAFLRGAQARLVEETTAEIRDQLSNLLKSFDRTEKYLPQFWNEQRRTLSSYDSVRRSFDLIPSPPEVTNPATFSIVVIDDAANPVDVAATLASVAGQMLKPCDTWLVVRADAPPETGPATAGAEIVRAMPDEPPLAAANRVAARTGGSHVIVIDAGVALAPAALAWLAVAVSQAGGAIIYADGEAKTADDEGRNRYSPLFRPAFDHDLLLQRNFIGDVFCVERQAFFGLEGFAADPALDARHDFLLRAAAKLGRAAFVHLPLLLASAAADKPTAARTVGTVAQHLERLGMNATAVAHADPIGRAVQNAAKIVWQANPADRISVIVPTRDAADMVLALASSLRRLAAAWDRVEVIVIVNGNPGPQSQFAFAEIEKLFDRVRIAYRPVPFNWGEINNAAVKDSSGEIVVFLNDDMVCLTESWDERLRGQLGRAEIGVVGGRLLYPNGAIQHAGITLCGDGRTAHEAMGDRPDDGLYLDRTLLVHEIGAVTGAFLACRRTVFDQLGGFDSARYAVTSSDADFCVRARLAGYRVIYDPWSSFIHYESASRGQDAHDHRKALRAEAEQEAWKTNFPEIDLVDPSLNPHLAGAARPFETFRRLAWHDIERWLEAQIRRGNSSAGPQPTGVQGVAARR